MAGEYEEIVGYHLEQAHRALLELGPPNDSSRGAGRSARPSASASAGERAFARGDMPAAVNLLSRATASLPAQHARRLELLPELAFALLETGDFDRLVAVVDEMEQAAVRDGGRRASRRTRSSSACGSGCSPNPEGWADEAEHEAKRAIAIFGRLEDERGLARAWSLLGLVG